MTMPSPRQCLIIGLGLVTLLVFLGIRTDMDKMDFGSRRDSLTRQATVIDIGNHTGKSIEITIPAVSNNASRSPVANAAVVSVLAEATNSGDMPSCLIYVRIGKAGSSSLMKYFNDSLGEEQVSHHLCYAKLGMRDLRKYSRKTARDDIKQVYQGHCGYGFDQYVCAKSKKQSSLFRNQSSTQIQNIQEQPSCFYYTWLREPISRVISSFIYNHKRGLPKNLTMYRKCFQHDTYCPMEKGPNWQNSMTYFLGSPRDEIHHENQPVNVTREHLEKAKQRLEQNFVAFGLLEYSKESLKMLQSILNVISTKKKNDQQTHQNRTTSNIQKPALLTHVNTGIGSDWFKERVRMELGSYIEQANQLDIELYAFAKQLFLDRLEKYGSTVAIPKKHTKDWNATVVQLHSCSEQFESNDSPWFHTTKDADKKRHTSKRPIVPVKNQKKYKSGPEH